MDLIYLLSSLELRWDKDNIRIGNSSWMAWLFEKLFI